VIAMPLGWKSNMVRACSTMSSLDNTIDVTTIQQKFAAGAQLLKPGLVLRSLDRFGVVAIEAERGPRPGCRNTTAGSSVVLGLAVRVPSDACSSMSGTTRSAVARCIARGLRVLLARESHWCWGNRSDNASGRLDMGTQRLAWAGSVMMSGGDHGHLAARHASDLRDEAAVDGGPSAFDQLQGAGHER